MAGPFSGEVISTVRVALGRARSVRDDLSPEILRVPRSPGGTQAVLAARPRIPDRGRIGRHRDRLPRDTGPGLPGARRLRDERQLVLLLEGRQRPDRRLAGAGLAGARPPELGRRRCAGCKPRIALRLRRQPALACACDGQLRASASPGRSCSDSLFTEPPVVDSRSAAGGLVLLLRSDDLGSLADTLRTRCPGPSQPDVLKAARSRTG